MASGSRNVSKPSSVQGFDSPVSNKMQSSTLKRQPSPDWSKSDLLRLLSYFEGELQARDITIASLKADKAKQLLYQAKYGRFGLGDPFVALQRDAEGKNDTGFDEAAIKSMYDNQLAQLENLIATQRKAQLKMREQLGSSEKRFHKVCSELEEEKQKHAQDTAQGDDVTYMLEKERERLKAEIDFEKSQNKKLEKDLKKTLASLEEERANAARHKQVAIILIKERKKLIENIIAENQLRDEVENALTDEKSRTVNMAEGLEMESKRSLKMEVAMEKQHCQFDSERESLRLRLHEEELHTNNLRMEVSRLSSQLESVQQQMRTRSSSPSSGGGVQTRSSASPGRIVNPPLVKNATGGTAAAASAAAAPPHAQAGQSYVVGRPARKDLDTVASFSSSSSPSSPVTSPLNKSTSESSSMEFLNPEMANLHQLLASMTTAEASESNSHVINTSAEKDAHVVTSAVASLISSSSSLSSLSTPSTTPFTPPHLLPLNLHSTSVKSSALQTLTDDNSKLVSPVRIAPLSKSTALEFQNSSQHFAVNFVTLPPSPTQTIPPSDIRSNGVQPSQSQGSSPSILVRPSNLRNFINQSAPSTYNMNNSRSSSSSSSSSEHEIYYEKTHDSSTFQLSIDDYNCNSLSEIDASNPMQTHLTATTSSSSYSQTQSKSVRRHPESIATAALSEDRGEGTITMTSVPPTDTTTTAVVVIETPPIGPVTELKTTGIVNDAVGPAPGSTSTVTADHLVNSPLHKLAAEGDVQALQQLMSEQKSDINIALPDGSTPLHCAVENNQEACMKLLMDNGARPSSLREDRITPLHLAVYKGFTGCTRLLLNKGAAVNLSATQSQTPLHLAVKRGHLECCQMLLRHGANVLYRGQDNLTSVHYAVQTNQPQMLQALLDRLKLNGTHRDSDAAHQLVAIVDGTGWSITHMAAALPNQDCLIKLAESLPLDFSCKDKDGRTAKEVASSKCHHLLVDFDRPSSPVLKVQIELQYFLAHSFVSSALLGGLDLNPGISWQAMEDRLQAVLKSYLAQLDVGLKTRRINRLDSDMNWSDKDFTLGLNVNNIKHFEMGYYKWTPGMQTDTSPYLILCNNEQKKVTIVVDDSDNMCDLIAFDVLHPVFNITNYIRLLEQYKSIIFYGPAGSGKSYLANRLAQCIASQENCLGRKPAVYQLSLQPGFTSVNFLNYLKQRNCVLPVNKDSPNHVPILVLDNLEVVDIAQLFGQLLDPMENRGIGHAFCLRGNADGENGMHYLQEHFYVIGTMNKARSLGVDLSVLPRFRWIQFRLDTEPMRGLLARHFLRRILNLYQGCLPPPDEPVFRAIEWVVCVWQRLNDSLVKLGLPEVGIGPCSLFKCPLESKDFSLILEWIRNLWNQHISPKVRDAVKRGTGSEAPSDGQQKVANTALYVLMQRSIILGCPLTGQDKESYLSKFSGSNELDIPLKSGDGRTKTATPGTKASLVQQRKVHGTSEHGGSISASRQKGFTGMSHSASYKERNGRGEQKSVVIGPSNIKRRSLSESSVNKAGRKEDQDSCQSGITTASALSQAKVAKLEVKSSKLMNIQSSFRSFGPADTNSSTPTQITPERANNASQIPVATKGGRVSPLLSLFSNNKNSSPSISPKKSRSSENISSTDLYSGMSKVGKPSSPFSFSLATPTSNLSSFKFLESSPTEEKISPLLSQMPDFSIFDKVPTPTDELPPSGKFIFMERSPTVGEAQKRREEEEQHQQQEVWSRRTDVGMPNQRQSDKRLYRL